MVNVKHNLLDKGSICYIRLEKRNSLVSNTSTCELVAVTKSSAVNTEKSTVPLEIRLRQSSLQKSDHSIIDNEKMRLYQLPFTVGKK